MKAPKTIPNNTSISTTAGKIPRVAADLGTPQTAHAQLSAGSAQASPVSKTRTLAKRLICFLRSSFLAVNGWATPYRYRASPAASTFS
ncbi:MAG: hypothetical protein PHP75_03705 [Methylacidiphilaceae bacterium]|nr:hypothetical protein [Candidatus Methylacidiphilaceae bacterium]